MKSIANQKVKTTVEHPGSNNIWMVRESGLFEISRSGVQSRYADGTCLPSNVAICPLCLWGDGGRACKPCTIKDEASMSWKLSCPAVCLNGITPPTQSQRRLLQKTAGKVLFVITGVNQTRIKATWSNATMGSWGENETYVSLPTNDIQKTIEEVIIALPAISGTVKVPPYGIETGKNTGEIIFVINGTNISQVNSLWPQAATKLTTQNITVKFRVSDDPQQDMRSIQILVDANQNLLILTRPYLQIDLTTPPPPTRPYLQIDLTTPPPPSTPIPVPVAYATVASMEINENITVNAAFLDMLVENVSSVVCSQSTFVFCNVTVLSVTVDNVTTFCKDSVCPGFEKRRRALLAVTNSSSNTQQKKRSCKADTAIYTDEKVSDFIQQLASVPYVTNVIVMPNTEVFNYADLYDSQAVMALVAQTFTVFKTIESSVLIPTTVIVGGIIIIVAAIICCCLIFCRLCRQQTVVYQILPTSSSIVESQFINTRISPNMHTLHTGSA